jgi:hypothetical protein
MHIHPDERKPHIFIATPLQCHSFSLEVVDDLMNEETAE